MLLRAAVAKKPTFFVPCLGLCVCRVWTRGVLCRARHQFQAGLSYQPFAADGDDAGCWSERFQHSFSRTSGDSLRRHSFHQSPSGHRVHGFVLHNVVVWRSHAHICRGVRGVDGVDVQTQRDLYDDGQVGFFYSFSFF